MENNKTGFQDFSRGKIICSSSILTKFLTLKKEILPHYVGGDFSFKSALLIIATSHKINSWWQYFLRCCLDNLMENVD